MRQALNEISTDRSLAKRSKAAPSALPSREDVVAFIANASGKVGKREIAQAFDIRGGDRIWLKQMLKDLEAEGTVDRRRKGVTRPGQLPAVVLADIKGRDRDGELMAEPAEWDDEEYGPRPRSSSPCPASLARASPCPASATGHSSGSSRYRAASFTPIRAGS